MSHRQIYAHSPAVPQPDNECLELLGRTTNGGRASRSRTDRQLSSLAWLEIDTRQPDHALPAGTAAAGLSSGDWPCAQVFYTDARGYQTNTAAYGAGRCRSG
ncbi:MAG TPA: hypothetical protein VFI30_02910 [Nocardioidaceae bacterium]|nr:hypothetical protein [Nocardioidaceae bacterium]